MLSQPERFDASDQGEQCPPEMLRSVQPETAAPTPLDPEQPLLIHFSLLDDVFEGVPTLSWEQAKNLRAVFGPKGGAQPPESA